jgi:ERCC4-type nuclease
MIIAPFTVAFDTREQLPFSFQDIRIERKRVFVLTQKRTLQTGDYSIVGYEDRICVERESLEDLYRTLGKERERFMRELERMRTMKCSAVVIEASWKQIANPTDDDPFFRSQVHPNSIIGTIVACASQFPNTRWKAAGNRANAEKFTFDILLQFYKGNEKNKPSYKTGQIFGTPATHTGCPELAGRIPSTGIALER